MPLSLRAAGTPCRLYEAEGMIHTWMLFPVEEAKAPADLFLSKDDETPAAPAADKDADKDKAKDKDDKK